MPVRSHAPPSVAPPMTSRVGPSRVGPRGRPSTRSRGRRTPSTPPNSPTSAVHRTRYGRRHARDDVNAGRYAGDTYCSPPPRGTFAVAPAPATLLLIPPRPATDWTLNGGTPMTRQRFLPPAARALALLLA